MLRSDAGRALALAAACCLLPAAAGAQAPAHLVFAHFHMPYAPHGASVEGYKRDIRDALAAGLDGFVLNMGAWSGEGGWYKQRTAMMFQAAKEAAPGFRLALSPDGSGGMPGEDYRDMIRTYARHPSYLRYRGRPVLFTWSGEGNGGGGLAARDWWRGEVLEPLRKEGIDLFFVPFFYTADYDETPSYDKLAANFNGTARDRKGQPVRGWWKDVVDGLYYFAGTGLPEHKAPSVLDVGEGYARMLRENGRLFMGGVSPLYWGNLQSPGRRYYEYRGGEGLAAQWDSIIRVQKPQWVELFTWTDFTEATYFSPTPEPAEGNYSLRTGYGMGYFPSHAGFTALNRYYVDWYKTGKRPPIDHDRLFYFYRTHPRDAHALDDPRGPVTDLRGDVRDEVYLTTMLTAPAVLRIAGGGRRTERAVPAGVAHSRAPLLPGAQEFSLWRNGQRVAAARGPAVDEEPAKYNFTVASGCVAAGLPDLAVDRVTWDPENPTPGTAVRLTARIANRGTAPADGKGIAVRFLVDGARVGDAAGISGRLAPGASREVSVVWPTRPGAHEVVALTDPGLRLTESDPFDNEGRRRIVVGPGIDVEYAAATHADGAAIDLGAGASAGGTVVTTLSGATPTVIADGPISVASAGRSSRAALSDPTGFRITVPADERQRTLRLYLGGARGGARLAARLGDDSPGYADGWEPFTRRDGAYGCVYTVSYRGKPGTQLVVEWKRTTGDGPVYLKAVANE